MSNFKLQGMRAADVVPSDTENIPSISGPGNARPCVLYIGTGGDLKVLTEGGDELIFVNIQDGSFFPVNVTKVFSTDTSATNIIAIW